jgi:hypothetical protein
MLTRTLRNRWPPSWRRSPLASPRRPFGPSRHWWPGCEPSQARAPSPECRSAPAWPDAATTLPTGSSRPHADQLGLVLLDLIATTLIPARAPVMLAVDDTLWRRTGRKLHGAALYAPLPARPPRRRYPRCGHRGALVRAGPRPRRRPVQGGPGQPPPRPAPLRTQRRLPHPSGRRPLPGRQTPT